MDNDIKEIIKDIEESKLSIKEIILKNNISMYRYYQIKKLLNLKKPYVLSKPKNTTHRKFKQLIEKSNNTNINIINFQKDLELGLKTFELMKKYDISLTDVNRLKNHK
jgi:hypothetical protein